MNNTNNYFDCLNDIWNCTKIKEARKYLENIKMNFHNLDKKQRKKYIKKLNELSYSSTISEFFESKKKYQIYYPNEAIRKIILDQFAKLNLKNFDKTIEELLEFLYPIMETHKTKRIFKKDIELILKIIIQKIPKFEKILKNITLNILIFNNSHQYLDSASIPSKDFQHFMIICFYMKNNNDYQQGLVNPIYVFLHELGHIICWIVTSKSREVPKSFFKDIEKYMNDSNLSNLDALEVFADSFAMAIMYNTPLNRYNPYSNFQEELYIALEKYFFKIITEL